MEEDHGSEHNMHWSNLDARSRMSSMVVGCAFPVCFLRFLLRPILVVVRVEQAGEEEEEEEDMPI